MFLGLSYGWIALIGFCAACMLCLFQPFVGGIWIGEEGLLSENFVIFMSLFFYTWMFRIMQLTYRDASGLWTKDWLKPYVSMALKLGLSIVAVLVFNNIIGVLVPTIIIMLLVYFPWEAKVLYKHLFNRSWSIYLKRVAIYTLINILGAFICRTICLAVMPQNTMLSFLVRLVIVCIVFPTIWLVTTHRFAEFKQLLGIAKGFISKRKAA